MVTARNRERDALYFKEGECMRFIRGTLTHEFFLFPTIRYDDQYVAVYLEIDWLKFYIGVVKYTDKE